jgi:hypothetical protein
MLIPHHMLCVLRAGLGRRVFVVLPPPTHLPQQMQLLIGARKCMCAHARRPQMLEPAAPLYSQTPLHAIAAGGAHRLHCLGLLVSTRPEPMRSHTSASAKFAFPHLSAQHDSSPSPGHLDDNHMRCCSSHAGQAQQMLPLPHPHSSPLNGATDCNTPTSPTPFTRSAWPRLYLQHCMRAACQAACMARGEGGGGARQLAGQASPRTPNTLFSSVPRESFPPSRRYRNEEALRGGAAEQVLHFF